MAQQSQLQHIPLTILQSAFYFLLFTFFVNHSQSEAIHIFQRQEPIFSLLKDLITIYARIGRSSFCGQRWDMVSSEWCDQNYLVKRMQLEGDENAPFEIIHNFRRGAAIGDRPRRKISACQRLQHIPEFTMRTRKMTAQIQLKHEASPHLTPNNQESFSNNADVPPKLEDPEEFLLREDDLQNGIPFGRDTGPDFMFNLEDNSHASNYSKLEKALFGFSMDDERMDEEPQPEGM